MPRKYTRKKRKTRRRRKNTRSLNTGMAITAFPFGKMKKVNHRYVEKNFTIDAGVAGASTSYYFSCNGMYDPNITSSGHQVLGFDQMASVFDHNIVIGSKIQVIYNSIDATYPQIVTLSIDDDTSSNTDMGNMIENGSCKYDIIAPVNTSASGRYTHKMTYAVNPSKWLGRSKPLSDPELKGSSSSNPTEQCFFNIAVASRSADDSAGISCTVIIDYTAIWIEPKTLGSS